MAQHKVRENRLRRMAGRQGLRLKKSGRRDPRAVDYGTYWLADPSGRLLVGGDFGTSIDEIEAILEAGTLSRRVHTDGGEREEEQQ